MYFLNALRLLSAAFGIHFSRHAARCWTVAGFMAVARNFLAVLFTFSSVLIAAVDCVEGPMFVQPIENVTVSIGRDAILKCVVQNLNTYKVAWLRVDTQTILTIHSHVITKNHRIAVNHVEQKTWYLHIRDVQESDKGWYMCQINTDPMKSQVGYMNVVAVPVSVPPDILDYPTSADMVIDENSDVSMRCAATGSPEPTVTWKREDGVLIKLANGSTVPNITGETLNLTKVDREHMAIYLCIASNGIPPSVSKRISLLVQFPPSVWIQFQLIGAYQGQKVTLECHCQAFPKSINYWARDNGEIIPHSTKFVPEIIGDNYKVHMKLTINYLDEHDFGIYKCISKNSLGDMEGSINVYKIPHPNLAVPTIKDKSAAHDKVDELSYRSENNEKDKVGKLLKETPSSSASNHFREIGSWKLIGMVLCRTFLDQSRIFVI
ncbi:neurotrimin-like isoform X1 [Euwallacea fornicatus]|uniref:neurotrimin-like isoform X1 n=1 Tax=Euwallacea fornicatus TaxID=995702 RepID=UPI00338ED80A